jgi:hypothetical protein
VAASVVFGAQLLTQGTKAARAAIVLDSPPTAEAVAVQLAGVVNAHAAKVGGGKIGHVSCLQGSPASYACSYVRIESVKGSSCALAILRWTPHADSTFTVQTSGRVALAPSECGPVRKVLHVLGTSG